MRHLSFWPALLAFLRQWTSGHRRDYAQHAQDWRHAKARYAATVRSHNGQRLAYATLRAKTNEVLRRELGR